MATVITWDDVSAIAPSLATADPALQAIVLAQVGREVGSGQWGDRQADGQVYLAAHLGTIALRRGASGGALLSETVGPLSRSFSAPLLNAGALGATVYGMEYDRIRSLLPCRFGLLA